MNVLKEQVARAPIFPEGGQERCQTLGAFSRLLGGERRGRAGGRMPAPHCNMACFRGFYNGLVCLARRCGFNARCAWHERQAVSD